MHGFQKKEIPMDGSLFIILTVVILKWTSRPLICHLGRVCWLLMVRQFYNNDFILYSNRGYGIRGSAFWFCQQQSLAMWFCTNHSTSMRCFPHLWNGQKTLPWLQQVIGNNKECHVLQAAVNICIVDVYIYSGINI